MLLIVIITTLSYTLPREMIWKVCNEKQSITI